MYPTYFKSQFKIVNSFRIFRFHWHVDIIILRVVLCMKHNDDTRNFLDTAKSINELSYYHYTLFHFNNFYFLIFSFISYVLLRWLIFNVLHFFAVLDERCYNKWYVILIKNNIFGTDWPLPSFRFFLTDPFRPTFTCSTSTMETP